MDDETIIERWTAIARGPSSVGRMDRAIRDRDIDRLVADVGADPAWTVVVERMVGRCALVFARRDHSRRLDAMCEDGLDGMTSMSIGDGGPQGGSDGVAPATRRRSTFTIGFTPWRRATTTKVASTTGYRHHRRWPFTTRA